MLIAVRTSRNFSTYLGIRGVVKDFFDESVLLIDVVGVHRIVDSIKLTSIDIGVPCRVSLKVLQPTSSFIVRELRMRHLHRFVMTFRADIVFL